MGKDSNDKRKRRRTCVDELRRDLARRRERRADPAGKMMLQVLALLSAVLALAPPVPALAYDLPQPRRSRWDPPPGYVLGREAWARERGLEPEPGRESLPTPHLRPMPTPRPWKRLVKDLDSRSGRRRDQSRNALMQRVPDEAQAWLQGLIASEDRTALAQIARRYATARWLRHVWCQHSN